MMANWRVLAIGPILFLITEVCVVMAQGVPVAEAPTYQVGDEWRYTDGSVLRVVAIEEGQVVTVGTASRRCPDCRYYRDKNFTVAKVVDKNGKAVDDPSVGLKTREFPLEVGKQWTSDSEVDAGGRFQNQSTFKVEEYREVETKAGTFKAFKINWTQFHEPTRGRIGRKSTRQATLWYSPEVKAVVKREVHTAQWLENVELESYALK